MSTRAELIAWEDDLVGREHDLAEREAAFEERVEALVDRKTGELWEALEIVRAAFPCGLRIEPWGPRAGGSVH